MFLFAHLRTLFTALFIALAIVACGGGGSGASPSNPLADDPEANQPVSQEVLGDDIDSDGIRDDVQMMIESEYAGNAEIIRRFKAMSILDRKAIINVHNQLEIDALYIQHLTKKICWMQAFPTDVQLDNAIDNYRAIAYNTIERIAVARLVEQRLALANKGAFVPTNLDCE